MWGQLPPLELREEQTWNHPHPQAEIETSLESMWLQPSGRWVCCGVRLDLAHKKPSAGVPVEFSGCRGLGLVCRKLPAGWWQTEAGPQASSHWGPSRTREGEWHWVSLILRQPQPRGEITQETERSLSSAVPCRVPPRPCVDTACHCASWQRKTVYNV